MTIQQNEIQLRMICVGPVNVTSTALRWEPKIYKTFADWQRSTGCNVKLFDIVCVTHDRSTRSSPLGALPLSKCSWETFFSHSRDDSLYLCKNPEMYVYDVRWGMTCRIPEIASVEEFSRVAYAGVYARRESNIKSNRARFCEHRAGHRG